MSRKTYARVVITCCLLLHSRRLLFLATLTQHRVALDRRLKQCPAVQKVRVAAFLCKLTVQGIAFKVLSVRSNGSDRLSGGSTYRSWHASPSLLIHVSYSPSEYARLPSSERTVIFSFVPASVISCLAGGREGRKKQVFRHSTKVPFFTLAGKTMYKNTCLYFCLLWGTLLV